MTELKIATYNANSIRARMELVVDWLERECPDVLCVQETKVQDKDFPAKPIQQAGYYVVFRGQKAHAGVAILSRVEPREVAYGLDDGGEPDEPRLIWAIHFWSSTRLAFSPRCSGKREASGRAGRISRDADGASLPCLVRYRVTVYRGRLLTPSRWNWSG